jgi:hypothetical protein
MPTVTLLRHGFHPSTLSVVFVVTLVALLTASSFVALGMFELFGAGRDGAASGLPITGLLLTRP